MMASSLVLRRVNTRPLIFSKLTNTIRSASVAPSFVSRFFSNDSHQVTTYDDTDRSVAVERPESSLSTRRDSIVPSLFSDVFDPFLPTRSLSQVMSLMDHMFDPLVPSGLGSGSSRRGRNVKEDKEAMYLRIDMPGVDKDKVKITVEKNTLIIRGEGEKESEEDEHGRIYTGRLDLPPGAYKLDEIKAELKNGVLKVIVPKVKEEERQVYEVRVE